MYDYKQRPSTHQSVILAAVWNQMSMWAIPTVHELKVYMMLFISKYNRLGLLHPGLSKIAARAGGPVSDIMKTLGSSSTSAQSSPG